MSEIGLVGLAVMGQVSTSPNCIPIDTDEINLHGDRPSLDQGPPHRSHR